MSKSVSKPRLSKTAALPRVGRAFVGYVLALRRWYGRENRRRAPRGRTFEQAGFRFARWVCTHNQKGSGF